jgi:hypothetical protein
MARKLIIEQIKELLAYDPETGVFTWKVDRGSGISKVTAGSVAGNSKSDGYLLIGINGTRISGQRLGFAFINGYFPKEVDHINGDPSDNRICNLRAATHQQNIASSKHRVNNTSGRKGVIPTNGRWRARISVNSKTIHLGMFDSVDDAHSAYMKAAHVHFGEFARSS